MATGPVDVEMTVASEFPPTLVGVEVVPVVAADGFGGGDPLPPFSDFDDGSS